MATLAESPVLAAVEPPGTLLREKVYRELRADMISCRLPPGLEIRETELAARFRVSNRRCATH